MRVLVVEDDSELAAWLQSTLTSTIGVTDVLDSIGEAEAALLTYQFNLVVVDRRLPDGDGLTLLPALKNCSPQPATLFLTALDDPNDIALALDRGADEYVGKPFEPAELVARAKAVLRRYALDQRGTGQIGNLSFDLHHRSVLVNHDPVEVPRRELAILEALVRRAGRVVQRETLELSVYRMDDEIESNAIDSHVSRLRRRLRQAGCDAQIRAVRGVGYLMTAR